MEQSYPNSNPQMISSGSSVYLDFRYALGFALPNVYIYIFKCVGPYTTEPLFFFSVMDVFLLLLPLRALLAIHAGKFMLKRNKKMFPP